MTTTSTDGFGSLFQGTSRSSYGTQTSWAIDFTLGSDANVGTPASPLKTMEEFNNRMQGTYVKVAMTLQLVGNVIDEQPQLMGTRFKLGASLTISGTRTSLGTGTITVVTAIGQSGTTFPWTLTTTGIDWTLIPVGSIIITSTSQVAFIRSVTDANNVVIGAMTTSTGTLVTPTALAFTVFALSRALPPAINASAQTVGSNTTGVLTLQDLSLDGGAGYDVTGIAVLLHRCECIFTTQSEIRNASCNNFLFRACRFSCTSSAPSLRGRVGLTACVFVSPSVRALLSTEGTHTITSGAFSKVGITSSGSRLLVSTGGAHFDLMTGSSTISMAFMSSVLMTVSGAILNGSNCTTSFGIDISSGTVQWPSGAAPTIGLASGSTTNDVRLGVGATTFTYAQIATGNGKQYAFLDAVPPTTTQIQGNASASIGQLG